MYTILISIIVIDLLNLETALFANVPDVFDENIDMEMATTCSWPADSFRIYLQRILRSSVDPRELHDVVSLGVRSTAKSGSCVTPIV